MIIYQICIAFIIIGSMGRCDTSDGVICGLCIWILLGVLPIIVKVKAKQMTNQEKYLCYRRYEYNKIYYNDYGELP